MAEENHYQVERTGEREKKNSCNGQIGQEKNQKEDCMEDQWKMSRR